MDATTEPTPTPADAASRSGRFLAALAPFERVVLASHVNPDPDALASMLGLAALIARALPDKPVVMTLDGIVARAENRAMVDLIPIPLSPVEEARTASPGTALVMVDTQPWTGRRGDEAATPTAVLDHHETGGSLRGVSYADIRPDLGATSTMVVGYLLEQGVEIPPRLATALMYGIESEVAGFPREAGPADDEALVRLFPLADKDLLAQIKNPKLPHDYFASVQHALGNAFLYRDLIFSWCGEVGQPDLVSELADYFIRFNEVCWAVSTGVFEGQLRISARVSHLGGHAGEVLREVVDGMGSAGGHDKRAGGSIRLVDTGPGAIDGLLRTIRHRLLSRLGIDEQQGRRLLEASPTIQAP